MKKRVSLLLLASCFSLHLAAQETLSFERRLPHGIESRGGEVSRSSLRQKDGKRSLQWDYNAQSQLEIPLTEVTLTPDKEEKYGITLWLYNENPQSDSLHFEFLSPEDNVSYSFTYNLQEAGWRAAWIGFKFMRGDKQDKNIASLRITAPNSQGRLFLDRLTFPITAVNLRNTPDLQIPYSNALNTRNLWHWCRTWEWEQYPHVEPLKEVDAETLAQLTEISERLDCHINAQPLRSGAIEAAYKVFKKAGIKRTKSGILEGAPLVAPDEIDRSKGELSWNDLETMLVGFAYDVLHNNSDKALANYLLVWDYAMDQGFAYGSGMGTNHHYGYQVLDLYDTAWQMRHHIRQAENADNIIATLLFWSALQETRKPYQYGRDELLDAWHTLLMPKVIAALIPADSRERSRNIQELSTWISTSLDFTPGTLGGIKVDGTTFHHGAFYPAYTSGAIGAIGQFIHLTQQTQYGLTLEARQNFGLALQTMRNCSNLTVWAYGLSARHPFARQEAPNALNRHDIEAYAELALSGGLEDATQPLDRAFAADYLRLQPRETENSKQFRAMGIQPAADPNGFWAYNYAAAGIFRQKNWMVTLKGFNRNVWSSEIYTRDNRYGRYQSYGSVTIQGTGNPVNEVASGYSEAGWDWNRVPGTTTIHLPMDSLNHPNGLGLVKATTRFSGASSLHNRYGVFVIDLKEDDTPTFTPDFVARKTVFCFDNRLIALGSGISNSNGIYRTETTLFQSAIEPQQHPTIQEQNYWKDPYGNYYLVKDGMVKQSVGVQHSKHNKTQEATQGNFATAWIDHGVNPHNATYEYMVLIHPEHSDLALLKEPSYVVHERTQRAHVVQDLLTNIWACAAFESYTATEGLVRNIPAETLVMYQPQGETLQMSITTPDLHINDQSYTTDEPSRPIVKSVTLQGKWTLPAYNSAVALRYSAGMTEITVVCVDGRGVEFELIEKK